jgi:hypothetical protein
VRALRTFVRVGIVAVVVAVAACGRINYDPLVDDDGDADVDGSGECPAGYTPVDGSCYRVESTQRMWAAAEADCESDGDGSHLVIMVDVAEHFAVHAMSEAQAGGAEVWIGYTDVIAEGTFQWIAGGGLDPSLDECFFGPSGPTNDATTNCVVQLSATQCGDWLVRDCAALRPYVCEHDGQLPVDGTF